MSTALPLALSMPGGWEWLVILLVALLIFGRRLPEVMRSTGRGVVEFKKGIKGIEEDVDTGSSTTSPPPRPKVQAPADSATPADSEDHR